MTTLTGVPGISRARAAILSLAALGLASCGERPPIDSVQIGFRGLAAEQNLNPRLLAARRAANAAPAPLPPAAPGDTTPGAYQNVQVLTGLGVGEFTRTMNAISEWVVPTSWVDPKDVNKANKCAYCHNLANLAADDKYQKVVARRMLQMVQHINGSYEGHVKQTGVTCYTCHRGAAVPVAPWYYTSRDQPLRHYLDRTGVLVTSNFALAAYDTNRSSLKQATYTYNVMANISSGLGVNCTYCHSTRAFNSWGQSTPKRLLALRGIEMVRDLNLHYMLSLQDVWPTARHGWAELSSDGTLMSGAASGARLGPMGDGAKLQCATCHQGVYKPLFGAPMAKDYPALYPGGGMASAGQARATAGSGPTPAAAPGLPGSTPTAAPSLPGSTPAAVTAPATEAPRPPAAVSPSAGSATDPGAGAMGGRGRSGKETAVPKP